MTAPMDQPSSLSTRRALLALVVVFGLLTAGAILQRDRTLDQVYQDATADARLYASPVLSSALIEADLAAPLDAVRSAVLTDEVESSIFARDDAVARVRLWSLDEVLLFSTDPADEPGTVADGVAISTAVSTNGGSLLVVDNVSPTTHAPDPRPTPLLETFTPIQLRGSTEPRAVAEVDQLASTLESRADEPWVVVQLAATTLTALLALLAFISLVRSSRRRPRRSVAVPSRLSAGAETGDLRERLERATTRAKDAEAAAAAYSSELDRANARLEALEGQSSDDRVLELREALRRSEAERALLRAGRPETTVEVEVRELRDALREARARVKATETLAARKGDASTIQRELAAAEAAREDASERANAAEMRAQTAEEQVRLTAELATSAEHRIDALESKLAGVLAGAADAEVAAGAVDVEHDATVERLRDELAAATERAAEAERRIADAEARAAETNGFVGGTSGAIPEDVLTALEERLAAAEARAAEAEKRIRAFEEDIGEGSSSFRTTLAERAAGRKLAAPIPVEPERITDPEVELRNAIARGLRGPLTRATGLTLSLQGTVGSSEGKTMVRQLSSSLRRLDQLTADLHDVRRILDGTLPLHRRRTDVASILATTLDEADQLQEDRMIRLETQHVSASVDPVRLRQIVEGMLGAARERTRPGAAIVVRAREVDRGVMISVEDDNRTPTTIGPELDLAARLAELHGTELVATGSSFRVVFPADEA